MRVGIEESHRGGGLGALDLADQSLDRGRQYQGQENEDVYKRQVLVILQAPFPGKGRAVVADGLGVPGAVGNGAHLLKKAEHALGLQIL